MLKSIPIVLLVVLATSSSAFGQRSLHNGSPKPACVTSVYLAGKEVAHLCVPGGATLDVDAKGKPTGGAGYYEAQAGEYFPVQTDTDHFQALMFEKTICNTDTLRVDKIAWDENGKLTTIEGLRSTFCTDGDQGLTIVSDVKNPKIVNGNLYIKLGDHGTTEYWVRLQFGRVFATGKVGDKDEISILDAARYGDLAMVKAAIKVDPASVSSEEPKHSCTPLHLAARYGHSDVAELLLANKANARVNNNCTTPLHFAMTADVAKLLLAHGADVNAKDSVGETPLAWAVSAGRKDVLEVLIASKADVNAKNNKGETPMQAAVAKGKQDIVDLLRQHGGQ
jgi:hypothetical protein